MGEKQFWGPDVTKETADVFYTRNTKDFAGFGFKSVINPIVDAVA